MCRVISVSGSMNTIQTFFKYLKLENGSKADFYALLGNPLSRFFLSFASVYRRKKNVITLAALYVVKCGYFFFPFNRIFFFLSLFLCSELQNNFRKVNIDPSNRHKIHGKFSTGTR